MRPSMARATPARRGRARRPVIVSAAAPATRHDIEVRSRAWIGSLVVHAGLFALALIALPHRDPRRPRATAIEVIAAPPRTPIVATTPGGSNGGAPAARASEPAAPTRRAAIKHRPVVRPRPAAPDPAAPAQTVPAPVESSAPPTTATAEAGTGNGVGEGAGDGVGNGEGNGAGDGHGDGRGATRPRLEPPAHAFDRMVSTPRSQARPARLVYPKRNRAEEAERLFIARLTVDADGLVVGVKMTSGPVGPLADKALSGVWRFRYDPARDDAGRPIQSTVVQRFMVD